MLITRKRMYAVLHEPVFQSKNIMGFYIIGAIVSFFIYGFRTIMIAQLLIAFIGLMIIDRVYNKLRNNKGFNKKATLLKSDLSINSFILFVAAYYVIYNGYQLFLSFDWLSLILLLFSTFFIKALWSRVVAINVVISSLSKFSDTDNVEMPEKDWRSLLLKWKLRDRAEDFEINPINSFNPTNKYSTLNNLELFISELLVKDGIAMVILINGTHDFVNIYRNSNVYNVSVPFITEFMKPRQSMVNEFCKSRNINIDNSSKVVSVLVCHIPTQDINLLKEFISVAFAINEKTPLEFQKWSEYNR